MTQRSIRTGPAPRRGRPGYDLPGLLRVAVELFNERGYDGTSMEDLARRLGITKSAIYHHVSSKDELLRLAVNRALDGLFAEVAKLDQVEGRALDKLEHLVRGSVHVLVDELPYVTLLLRVRGNTQVERDALARRREFDQIVTSLVDKAIYERDIRSISDRSTMARLLFGMVNSIIEWYRPGGPRNADALAEMVVDMAFHGLRGLPRPRATGSPR